jgi:5-(carboxyamino)imidazole ribonucleotide synthase
MTTTVGIIGDGQLGMLLCEAAPILAVETVMLTGNADGPAAQRATAAIEGAMDDEVALATLIEHCDIITYEREDIPPLALEQLAIAEASGATRCFPRLETIKLLQDKALQKTWLAEHELATLPFVLGDGSPEVLQQAVEQLGFPLIQKSLRGGFDGRGVQLLRDAESLAKAWPGDTLFEQFAGTFHEVAVLVARREDGQSTHYGPVDMTFESEHSILDTVTAPSAIGADLRAAATALAYRAIDTLDGVGVFGVEMFVLGGTEVLINEISPRVHNAGHYTLEGCATSQFEQHLRAISGLPLGDTSLNRPTAMRNVLCTAALNDAGSTEVAGKHADAVGSAVYWYGKSPARLMRKLGHVTAQGESAQAALTRTAASWSVIQKQAEVQTRGRK